MNEIDPFSDDRPRRNNSPTSKLHLAIKNILKTGQEGVDYTAEQILVDGSYTDIIATLLDLTNQGRIDGFTVPERHADGGYKAQAYRFADRVIGDELSRHNLEKFRST